jgi:hypothetical protein
MAHVQLELAQDRLRSLQAAAALHHEARRALIHGRTVRQAERAERKTLCHARNARQLRARIAELEVGI